MEKLLTKCGLNISLKLVHEVDWPVYGFKELLRNLTPRNLVLFVAKQIDKIFARVFRNYGTRYFFVCKKIDVNEIES
jgi:hypothetical protein